MNQHYNVIELICSESKINVDVLLSERRYAEIVKCRGLIILIMREIYNLNFRQIAEMMNRSTSTIIKTYHKIDDEINRDKELYHKYYLFYNLLKKRGMVS